MREKRFFKAKLATPILSTPNWHDVFGGETGCSLDLNEKGFLLSVETIALPGTKFEVIQQCSTHIYEIKTTDYRSSCKLFIDVRFAQEVSSNAPDRIPHLPRAHEILKKLEEFQGISYVWGGNYSKGIPEILSYYPPSKPIDDHIRNIWSFQGVDCSGLLYEATHGFTPRNTSELVKYGLEIPYRERSTEEIVADLKPLDLIVWKGHVIIVFSSTSTIQSKEGKGVIFSRIEDSLKIAAEQSVPFYIRRWHPDCFQNAISL